MSKISTYKFSTVEEADVFLQTKEKSSYLRELDPSEYTIVGPTEYTQKLLEKIRIRNIKFYNLEPIKLFIDTKTELYYVPVPFEEKMELDKEGNLTPTGKYEISEINEKYEKEDAEYTELQSLDDKLKEEKLIEEKIENMDEKSINENDIKVEE